MPRDTQRSGRPASGDRRRASRVTNPSRVLRCVARMRAGDVDSRSGDPTEDLQRAPQRLRSGVYLRVFGEGLFVTHFAPLRGTLTIGRSRTADLHVDHQSLSRTHVRLYLDPPLRIEDLGSTNGTYLDARRLAPHAVAELRRGAVAEIG